MKSRLQLSLLGVLSLAPVAGLSSSAQAEAPSQEHHPPTDYPTAPSSTRSHRAHRKAEINKAVMQPGVSGLEQNPGFMTLEAPSFSSSSAVSSKRPDLPQLRALVFSDGELESPALAALRSDFSQMGEWTTGLVPTQINLLTSASTVASSTEESGTATPSTALLTADDLHIVSPAAYGVLDVPATSITLQFPPHSQVKLTINGRELDDSAVGRSSLDSDRQTLTKTWYGISLQPGKNTIIAQGLINGIEQTIEREITVRGAAAKLSLTTAETHLPADGRSLATVKGQLLDEDGNRSNYSAVVTLSASRGSFVGEDASYGQPGFQVQAYNGEFTTQLQAPMTAGTAYLRASSAELEAYRQIQFETAQRAGLVSGSVDLRYGKQGLNYYDRFENYLTEDEPAYKLSGGGAIFATGSIGEWLFTGAYNSDRPLNENCNCDNNLYNAQDQLSDFAYPVQGDSSSTTKTTPSIDHFYARLERTSTTAGATPDFLLWGDYNTTEFASPSQEFTATTRQLHGSKLNYNWGDLQLTGLFANNIEGFQRDVIAPDGTSGFYFLSQRLLLPGSETIFIELEALERPGTVVERQQLLRGQDYEINYDRGSIRFREAVLRTALDDEGQVLVRRIVASYQHEAGENTSLYGIRGRYHLNRDVQGASWLGATALWENKGDRDFSLQGIDAAFALGHWGKLTGEYAHSSNESLFSGQESGSAYQFNWTGQPWTQASARAYYRHADTGFSNQATLSFVPGQTRYGAELAAQVGPTTNLNLGFDREENQGTSIRPIVTVSDLLAAEAEALPGQRVDNRLSTISAGLQQRLGSANLDLDLIYRDRQDHLNRERSRGSSQLRSRFAMPLAKNLQLNLLNETTLSSRSDSVYADRTQVGLDYKIWPGLNLGLNQHWFTSGQFSGKSFTTLDLTGDYNLLDNTTLTGRYSVISSLDGMRGQGAVGLKQRWVLSEGVNLDFSYERFVGSLFGQTGAGDRAQQPVLVGANSSSLGVNSGDSFNVGVEYTTHPDIKASARYERANSSGGSSTNVTAAVTGKISPSLTGLLRFDRSNNGNQGLRNYGDTTELRFGLAYRDIAEDKLNALLRYEYRRNPSFIPEAILLGDGTGSHEHLVAAEAIYAPAWDWELYGKIALRQSETDLARDLVGNTTTTLGQLRATYRLHDSFDLVGEARWIGQSDGYSELGYVVEGGYYMTPDLRLGLGYGFGRVRDRDFNGSRAASGPYVGVTLKLNELFDGFGRQEPTPTPTDPVKPET